MPIFVREFASYSEAEIMPLYESAGWTNYTQIPDMLRGAYENSPCALAAYDGDAIVGILRMVGDGESIVYIQDIIVRPERQRSGIGSLLLKAALERYENVYQIVLMTDDTEKTIAFYRKNGFTSAADMGCTAFMKIRG